jgi:hypothetical protein
MPNEKANGTSLLQSDATNSSDQTSPSNDQNPLNPMDSTSGPIESMVAPCDRLILELVNKLSDLSMEWWQSVLLVWLERFSGLEHEVGHPDDLPVAQVLHCFDGKFHASDALLAARLAQCDFLTWRVHQDPDTWDWRKETLRHFVAQHPAATMYQLDEPLVSTAETARWLMAQVAQCR